MAEMKPSGTCFDDALDYFLIVPVELRESHTVVHAICQRFGELFAHAWVEYSDGARRYFFEGVRVDGVKGYRCLTPTEHASRFIVVETTRYTFAEALAENARHDTFGPWIPRYLALTKPRPA